MAVKAIYVYGRRAIIWSLVQTDALAKLLIEKDISQQEFLAKISEETGNVSHAGARRKTCPVFLMSLY